MDNKKRLKATLLAALMMAGMTLHAAQPQQSFFARAKNSITKFIQRLPKSVKWTAAFAASSFIFFLACSQEPFKSYEDLVDSNEYAGTVLPANNRNFAPAQFHTPRGLIHIEQFDVAKQNLRMRMCTCGQHAVTQANIIADSIRNGWDNGALANTLRDRNFMGFSVQETCRIAKDLNEAHRGFYRDNLEPQQGWTQLELLDLMLQQNAGSYFVGNEVPENISPRNPVPHPAIAQLNAIGVHRVILNIGAHWITIVINRPVANGRGTYYIADSAGCDRRNNPRVLQFINNLEQRAPALVHGPL